MKAVILGAAAASALLEDASHQAFFSFVKEFNKQYPTEEVFDRYNTFKANLELINAHNNGSSSWKMGVNQFADLSPAEFKAYLGLKPRDNSYLRSQNLAALTSGPANDIDWVSKGAVTPVKDQAQCGSCWAFSTTGAVEGAVQVKTGRLTSVSEQQLVDCAGSSGNQGCNGGLMDDAFNWIISHRGIGSEASYPYTARDGTCKDVPSVSTISAFKDVQQGSESALMDALNMQPVAIAIEADQSSFQMYKSGVFTGPCGTQLDHGVLLVGSGTDGGQDYWRIKNSWGSSWGDNGFIRFIRGKNMCGLSNMASFPVA
jgi:C1A family cysteine protease